MVYLGSKQRIIKNILPYMLSDKYNTFVDLFCGGCSVIENVPKKYRRIANISEYTAPADFRVIYQESINNSMNNTTATEKLFVHETQYNEVMEEYLQKYPRLF